ncbi:MAG: tRNA 2-thiocytidine(32) synthetase TtcA [Clostridiaceae bacterium]|nr:tRNA 2-thiocytidine(32) synthetase TtcA [Clostridiaceae bacterium]
MQKILSYMRKAIRAYDMIQDGDKIAVCLSGGKDSITMLLGLKQLQTYFDKDFDIVAVSVNPGFEFFDCAFLQKICDEIQVPLIIENSDIKQIVFDIRDEKRPCSLCANIRRGILNSVAIREGCNKIALGHNEDDALETLLMNLFLTGSFSTFGPTSYMDRSKITVIRPLIYTSEKEIKKFIKRQNIKVMNKTCPMDGVSKREYMKDLLYKLNLDIPMCRSNLLGVIKRNTIKGWHE